VDDLIAAYDPSIASYIPAERACDDCPQMAIIPASVGLLGAPDGEKNHFNDDEFPQVVIEFPAFEISLFEITYAEYDKCVDAFACSEYPEDSKEFGRGVRPVVNVSIEQVEEYLAWLNKSNSGAPFRLPSEAEWEHAARAGSKGMWSTGDELTATHANFDNGARRTMAVGSYRPNAFGLYDMHGNVAEWVADCYVASHAHRDKGPGPRTDGRCNTRVTKGGNYKQNENYNRLTKRNRHNAKDGEYDLGFRVARSLEP